MVDMLPKMVDMARDQDEKTDDMSVNQQPDYPYGLCLSLSQSELDKLDLDNDCEVGDLLHMHCIAKVTSVSKREINGEPDCRIELQIQYIAAVENEDDENEEVEQKMEPSKKLYR